MTMAVLTVPRSTPATIDHRCTDCDGCGMVADRKPEHTWAECLAVPAGSAVAMLVGSLRPVPCSKCGGSGSNARAA